MTGIDHVLTCGGFQSQTVEYEAINALHQFVYQTGHCGCHGYISLYVRLLVQVPAAMGEIALQWGQLIYGHVMSPAPKVSVKRSLQCTKCNILRDASLQYKV